MSLAQPLLHGLAALIDNAAVAEFAKEAGKQALSVLKAHFTFSAHELTKAYQESFAKSLDAINNTLANKNSWFASKLNKEFSQQFSAEIIGSGISSKDLVPFIKNKSLLFQVNSIDDSDLASFINVQDSVALTDFLLEQMQNVSPLDNSLVLALRKDDLLSRVMLFFLHEQFRSDSRFEKTLMALQQEALLFNQQRMLTIMKELQISSRVKASDEFTQHNTKTQQIIQKSVLNLQDLSTDLSDYTKFGLMLGSAVSSTGNLDKSELLFSEIIANDNATEEEKARAFFNLFQIRVRGKDYQNALSALKAAIAINPDAYALHDVNTYPILQILGVGGMGCVFLCENDNPLIDNKNVVVKCFWESVIGSGKKVFKEAIAMRQIAGDYVPIPLDAGYANRHEQKNAFFVTEYIEGTIDGEAWLKKYGKMDLETGLVVAFTIAKALQLAHDKEVLHLDLKPANILLTDSSSAVPLKIIDFGLSQIAPSLQQEALTRQNQSGLTQFGQAVMGTLHYAPPEQQGYFEYGVPTVRSDIFSFGATMYRFWTDLRPRSFSERKLPNVPELRELVFDCVEEDPNNRPASAGLVVEQLEKILKPTPKAPTPKAPIPKAPTPIPKSKDFEVFRDNLKDGNKGPEMVWIPAGSFQMGSNDWSDTKPVHEVSLDRFAIGKYQVTVGEYLRFVESTGQHAPEWMEKGSSYNIKTGTDDYYKKLGSALTNENHPIVGVSWHDATAYMKWLSEQTGYIYRLPTEAEWEYMARAGSTTSYCFGDDDSGLGDYAWYDDDNSSYQTHPVGEKKANAWGLHDVHGNVWEWCADIYSSDYYSSSPRSNPTGPGGGETGRYRVQRGGAWFSIAQDARSANRYYDSPEIRYDSVGFRLLRQPS